MRNEEVLVVADTKEEAVHKIVEHMKTHNKKKVCFFSTEQSIKYLRVRKDIKYNMVLH